MKRVLCILLLLSMTVLSCKKDDTSGNPTNPQSGIPTNGLILSYTFENSIMDNSPLSNHGIDLGSLQYDAGKVGKSGKFSGSTYIKPSSNLQIESCSFTISAWVKTSNQTSEQSIINRGCVEQSGGLYGYAIAFNYTNSSIAFWVGKGSNISDGSLVTTTNIWDNQWHHIACVYSKEHLKMQMFIDGVLKTEKNTNAGNIVYLPTKDSGTTIGRRVSGDINFSQLNGNMDQLRVYNRALTISEIQKLYTE